MLQAGKTCVQQHVKMGKKYHTFHHCHSKTTTKGTFFFPTKMVWHNCKTQLEASESLIKYLRKQKNVVSKNLFPQCQFLSAKIFLTWNSCFRNIFEMQPPFPKFINFYQAFYQTLFIPPPGYNYFVFHFVFLFSWN